MAPMTEYNSKAQKGGGVALYINNIHFFSATEMNGFGIVVESMLIKTKGETNRSNASIVSITV